MLDLLKCALLSKTPLTDWFLEMKPIVDKSSIFSCDFKNIMSSRIHITVKLVIRKSDGNILYAQGGQDFADFIMRFLTFPLGGVLRTLQGNSSLGSIDGLCRSISDLNEDKYLMSKDARNRLLKLNVLQYYCRYRFDSSNNGITDVSLFKSDEHRSHEGNFRKMKLVDTTLSIEIPYGYVKRLEMYVVTDDLVVEPLVSPLSSLYLLNHFQTPLDDLKEKVVVIGKKEVTVLKLYRSVNITILCFFV